ncbi:MAG: stage II sporulation protein P [Desulfitobacteriaceae bacterium]
MLKKTWMEWLRRLGLLLGSLVFLVAMIFSVQSGSSKQLIRLLAEQRFPFEALLLEGIPGYSQTERTRLDEVRQQGASLGMFLLTGVNVSDARTFFLSYFAPPPQGPAWWGWAYNPQDPEFEGPIAEQSAGDTGRSTGSSGVDAGTLPGSEGTQVPPNTVKVSGVLVGIYNTHNAESYTGNGGPERRPGENGDVVAVGETLKQALGKNGIGAVHSTVINDAVDFMKAYSHSAKVATKILQDFPTIRILLDIHRDGFPPGVSKETVNVKGKEVAKVLIVIGKKNPHWEKNEELAKELIQLGERKYPGLFVSKISYAEDARYNQHFSDGGLLLEFGSQLNTLAEANGSAEAVAEILADWLKIHDSR